MYNQTKPFNQSEATTVVGLCLENVRKGFDIPGKYPDAWAAWEATDQHTDAIPSGVSVPLFYSYDGPSNGHVNVSLSNGQVWSDGTIYASVAAFEAEHYPKYVGWSTSIDGESVVAEVAAPPPPPAPAPAPEPEPAPALAPQTYTVVKNINGYITSNDAANHIGVVVPVEAGSYSIFNEAHGMINVTTKAGTPGSWINPNDNVVTVVTPPTPEVPEVAAPTPTPATPSTASDFDVTVPAAAAPATASDTAETVPVKTGVAALESNYQRFMNPQQFEATKTVTIHDLANVEPNVQLLEGQTVTVAGKIKIGDTEYYRTVKSVQNNQWYGIPIEDTSDDIDNLVKDISNDMKTADKVEGKITSLFHRNKKKG